MKLSYKSSSTSIRGFDPVELPQLTVLTGLNGAGKTHLLQSLVSGASILGDLPKERVKYYDLLSFRAKDDKPMQSAQIVQYQQQAWTFFASGNNKIKPRALSLQIFQQCFLHKQDDQTIDLWADHSNEDTRIWRKKKIKCGSKFEITCEKYAEAIRTQIFNNPDFSGVSNAQAIIKSLKKINKPLHLVSVSEMNEHFVPMTAPQDYLAISVSTIFTRYKVSQFEWVVAEQQRRRNESVSVSELELEYEARVSKPWNTINEIIKKIHIAGGKEKVFDFSITDPSADILDIGNHLTYQFQAYLKDNKTGVPRSFGQLSSGEKVLLALTFTIFEVENGNEFPGLILLDEVDASLHPSMTYALLQTLKTAFVENGVQVILVTHSPSTIAMSDEEYLFSISRDDNRHKLTKETHPSAMGIVSEGFATLENGIALFNNVAHHSVTIITEGHNVDILRRACALYDCKDVHVMDCFKGNSGKNQLSTLFQFFCQAAHERPVLFVLDCDVSHRKDENNNHWFVLPQNESNKLATKGIENIFPEACFEGLTTSIEDSFKKETVVFDKSRKLDFANHVVNNGTKDMYAVFKPLFDTIERIREDTKSELEAEAEEPSKTT